MFAKTLILSDSKKQEILELYAKTFKEENYPPVAGKILGLFFISNKKHLTFEELMSGVEASKSAISKSLKFLLEIGEVNFVNLKENKRRRYFYLDVEGHMKRHQRIIEAFHIRTQLLENTLKFRNEENMELNMFIENTIEFNKQVLNYFEKKLKMHF